MSRWPVWAAAPERASDTTGCFRLARGPWLPARPCLQVPLDDERCHPHFLGTGEWVAPSNLRRVGSPIQSLVPERGWPRPIPLGIGEWVAPSNPQSATSELARRSRGRSLPWTQTGSRRSRAHRGHLSRQSRSGNGPRLRPRHSQDGPCQACAGSERLHSGRGGVAERKIQPLLRDQCLAGQFGPLRQNARAIPRAVLAWLAAHVFQPDRVCKSHWAAGKVGVRAHGAWDHEVLERHL